MRVFGLKTSAHLKIIGPVRGRLNTYGVVWYLNGRDTDPAKQITLPR